MRDENDGMHVNRGGGVSLVVTHSDMQTYQACARNWYFRVYRRLAPNRAAVTGALALGSRVHAALEAFEDGSAPSAAEAWDALIQHDAAVLQASGMSTDDLEKEHRLGRTMLEGFAEWEEESGFHDEFEVLAPEVGLSSHLSLPELPGVGILVRGKLDRVLKRRSDGSLWVNDFKTMANFGERDRAGLLASPQARLYIMLMRANHPEGEWVAGMVYTLLRKVLRTARATPPFYDAMTVQINDHDLEQHRLRMIGIIHRISDATAALDSGADHRVVTPFNPSWQCQTCPFRHPCGLMQSTSMQAAEEFIADQFHERDPWERYGDQVADE